MRRDTRPHCASCGASNEPSEKFLLHVYYSTRDIPALLADEDDTP